MKKTKLFTSLAALVLVLSLGACSEPVEEDVSSEDNEPTSSETTSEENTSETTNEGNTSGGEGGVEGQYEDNTITQMISAIEEDCNYYAENTYLLYQSDVVSEPTSVSMSPVQWFECDEYATEDALYLDYYQIEYAYGSQGYGWYMYYWDAELYVNDYENNQTLVYYVDQSQGYYGQNYITGAWYLALADTWEGTWEDNIGNLGNLAPYRYAFTTTFSYYGYEMYDVDESALDAVIAATIGNNYCWDALLQDSSGNIGGWGDFYFGYPDYVGAADIFAGVEADAYGLIYGSPLVEFAFDDGGGWYGTTGEVYAMEVMAYTDIDLESVGTTSLPTSHYTIVETN